MSFNEFWDKEFEELDAFLASGLSPNRQLTFKEPSYCLSDIMGDSGTVQDSSDGQHSFQDSLKTFGQNANAGPQGTSAESIPPWLWPLMPTSEKQNYAESSHHFSGYSNNFSILPSGPEIPAMYCGKKRQDAPDNLGESGQWLGNYPTTKEIAMPLGIAFKSHELKATYSMLSGGTLTPDALAISTLGTTSTQPSSSFSSIENTKSSFHNLLALRLEVLSNPEKETSMKNVLSILADNLSLFSEKQGDQILELLLEFPALVHNWRVYYSQFHVYRQQSSAETEKIRDLVENSGKDEESLKVRYGILENKEKELMTRLDEVLKEKAEIAEQRTEKSKQTKDLKEKEAHQNKEERLMRIATAKLNDLSVQWAKLQAVFI